MTESEKLPTSFLQSCAEFLKHNKFLYLATTHWTNRK